MFLTGLDLERQPDKGKSAVSLLLRAGLLSEADPGSRRTHGCPTKGQAQPQAESCSGDSWSRRSPGSCSAHCCSRQLPLLPGLGMLMGMAQFLIPARRSRTHGQMEDRGIPALFSTGGEEETSSGRGLANGPGRKLVLKESPCLKQLQNWHMFYLNNSSERKN